MGWVGSRSGHASPFGALPPSDLGALFWAFGPFPKQVKKFFEEVLRWQMGVQYQVVALQAVMADLLGGDTIHHSCGIPVFARKSTSENQSQRQMDVAKRVLQWRWLYH